MVSLGACNLNPRHRAFEVVAFAGQLDRYEGAAASGRGLSIEFEAKIGQYAPESARLALVALFQLRQPERLAVIEPVERSLDPRQPGVDIGVLAAAARARGAIRLERRAAITRRIAEQRFS